MIDLYFYQGDYTPPGDSMDGSLCDCIGVHGLDEVLCCKYIHTTIGYSGRYVKDKSSSGIY